MVYLQFILLILECYQKISLAEELKQLSKIGDRKGTNLLHELTKITAIDC